MNLDDRFKELILKDVWSTLAYATQQALIRDLNTMNLDNSNNVYVYTHGECIHSGTPEAKAIYSIYFDDPMYSLFSQTLNVNDPSPTTQLAELKAVKKTIDVIMGNSRSFVKKTVVIVVDSMYVINCIKKWYKTWKANNWITTRNKPVLYKEYITQIEKNINELEEKEISVLWKHIQSNKEEPVDKDSQEYKLWYGNYYVKGRVNKELNKRG